MVFINDRGKNRLQHSYSETEERKKQNPAKPGFCLTSCVVLPWLVTPLTIPYIHPVCVLYYRYISPLAQSAIMDYLCKHFLTINQFLWGFGQYHLETGTGLVPTTGNDRPLMQANDFSAKRQTQSGSACACFG